MPDVTVDSLNEWATQAAPGDTLIYARAASVASGGASRIPVANAAAKLEMAGLVHLTKKASGETDGHGCRIWEHRATRARRRG